jgi:hypothetical protein
MEPVVKFDIFGADGQDHSIDSTYLFNTLAQEGANPVKISPDGLTVTLRDAEGDYDVKAQDILKDKGWQVKGVAPVAPVTDHAKPEWRAAVSQLQDDTMREAYIRGQVQKLGVENPVVVGSGRDWHVFNPATGQWVAATNSPDWDSTDLVEGGLMGARAAGSVLGGIAGTLAAGPGAGTAAGAGLGGMATDVGMKTALGAMDPDFAELEMANLPKVGAHVAAGGALDAVTGGVGKFLPGIGSRVAQGTGAALETAGKGVSALAGLAKKPLAADILGGVAAPNASLGAFGAQIPAGAVKSIPRAAEWAGEKLAQGAESLGAKGFGSGLVDDLWMAGGKMADWGRKIGTPRGAPSPLQAYTARMAGKDTTTRTATTQDVLGNLAEEYVPSQARRAAAMGDALEGMADTGRTVEGAIRTGVRAAAGATQGVAAGVQGVGTAARVAGTLARPVEGQYLARFGSEEMTPRLGEGIYDAATNPAAQSTMLRPDIDAMDAIGRDWERMRRARPALSYPYSPMNPEFLRRAEQNPALLMNGQGRPPPRRPRFPGAHDH